MNASPKRSVCVASSLLVAYGVGSLGVVLGLLTVRSRSIYPAMMFHFLYYSALLGGVRVGTTVLEQFPLEWRDTFKNVWFIWVSGCGAAALWLLWRLYRKPYVELELLEQKLALEAKEKAAVGEPGA